MSTELLVVMVVQLLGVLVQLQRLIPVMRKQVIATNEGNAGVRRLLEHFRIVPPEVVEMRKAAPPAAAAK